MIQAFKKALIQAGNFDPREIQGCSGQELADWNAQLPDGVTLPPLLVEFYQSVGRQVAWYKPAEWFYYPEIVSANLTFVARYNDPDVFGDDFEVPIPKDAFLLAENQEFACWFIRLSEETQGFPVYFWEDEQDMPGFVKKFDGFEDFLQFLLEDFQQKNTRYQEEKYRDLFQIIRLVVREIWDVIDKLEAHPQYDQEEKLQIAVRNYKRLSKAVYQAWPQSRKQRFIPKIDLEIQSRAEGLIQQSGLPEAEKAPIIAAMQQITEKITLLYA